MVGRFTEKKKRTQRYCERDLFCLAYPLTLTFQRDREDGPHELRLNGRQKPLKVPSLLYTVYYYLHDDVSVQQNRQSQRDRLLLLRHQGSLTPNFA